MQISSKYTSITLLTGGAEPTVGLQGSSPSDRPLDPRSLSYNFFAMNTLRGEAKVIYR